VCKGPAQNLQLVHGHSALHLAHVVSAALQTHLCVPEASFPAHIAGVVAGLLRAYCLEPGAAGDDGALLLVLWQWLHSDVCTAAVILRHLLVPHLLFNWSNFCCACLVGNLPKWRYWCIQVHRHGMVKCC
jgi:hypothetical protein